MKPPIKMYSEAVIKEKENLNSFVIRIYNKLMLDPTLDPCAILTETGKRVAVVSVKEPSYNTHKVK